MHGSVRERRGRERLTATRGMGKERGDGVDQRVRVLERGSREWRREEGKEGVKEVWR